MATVSHYDMHKGHKTNTNNRANEPMIQFDANDKVNQIMYMYKIS